jgi:hypothetical protein
MSVKIIREKNQVTEFAVTSNKSAEDVAAAAALQSNRSVRFVDFLGARFPGGAHHRLGVSERVAQLFTYCECLAYQNPELKEQIWAEYHGEMRYFASDGRTSDMHEMDIGVNRSGEVDINCVVCGATSALARLELTRIVNSEAKKCDTE